MSISAEENHEVVEGCLDCPHPDYCAGMGKCDTEACEECGIMPLYFTDEFGQVIRVDDCFRGLLGKVISACCGHGGRKPAYVRIQKGNGTVDICGGRVIDYGEFTRE